MIRTVAALLVAVTLIGCADDDPVASGLEALPSSCALLTVRPNVDAELVSDEFLLEGAEVTQARKTPKRLVAAINNPHSVNASFDQYKQTVKEAGYAIVGQDNEGFEAELYLRRGAFLGAIQIRTSRCPEATVVFVNLVRT